MASPRAPHAFESWTVDLLPLPRGQTRARAVGFGAGGILGITEARRLPPRRCLWLDGRPVPIDDPKGFEAWAAGPGQLVGRRIVGEKDRAVVCERRGDAWTPTELHPAGYASSVATGCATGQQVGYGTPSGQPALGAIERALLWSGSPDGVVELRGPDRERQTRALAVRDGVQVGEYGRNLGCRAAMWRGATEPMVELHPTPPKGYPPDAQMSRAHGVGAGQQVGVVGWKKTALAEQVARAALWTDTAASFVDLTPRGCRDAWAFACAGGLQVGWATRSAKDARSHAILWSGSAAAHVDLHALLPAPWSRSSAADVAVDGSTVRVVGTVTELATEGGYEVARAEQIAVWRAALPG